MTDTMRRSTKVGDVPRQRRARATRAGGSRCALNEGRGRSPTTPAARAKRCPTPRTLNEGRGRSPTTPRPAVLGVGAGLGRSTKVGDVPRQRRRQRSCSRRPSRALNEGRGRSPTTPRRRMRPRAGGCAAQRRSGTFPDNAGAGVSATCVGVPPAQRRSGTFPDNASTSSPGSWLSLPAQRRSGTFPDNAPPSCGSRTVAMCSAQRRSGTFPDNASQRLVRSRVWQTPLNEGRGRSPTTPGQRPRSPGRFLPLNEGRGRSPTTPPMAGTPS